MKGSVPGFGESTWVVLGGWIRGRWVLKVPERRTVGVPGSVQQVPPLAAPCYFHPHLPELGLEAEPLPSWT